MRSGWRAAEDTHRYVRGLTIGPGNDVSTQDLEAAPRRPGKKMSAKSRFEGPGPDEVWRSALAGGRFLIQRCQLCGGHRFPPALACVQCGSSLLDWVTASGKGTVHAATVVRQRDGSYNVSLIDLAEGPRMMSRVEGLVPDAVRIGMQVAARIIAGPEPFVVFVPAEESAT